jgi:3-hydroxyisobutyrate dehydrogenase-like beta-hydroxyacid dehydrogenase
MSGETDATRETVAILHPGEMGAAIGACLRAKGLRVIWASAGRSSASRRRAEEAGLEDAGGLAEALGACSIAFSVCPPHAALDLAREVASLGFRGLYIDANALAPASALEVGESVSAAGASYLDGAIIGPPPAGRSKARLYLSGAGAARMAALFSAGQLEALALDGPAGAASALKMCFAAWNKGTIALLAVIEALAAHHEVKDQLLAEWTRTDPEVIERLDRVSASARKAWRWSGEMEEIAATFEQAGLPGGFHQAAAQVYERLEGFKDSASPPSFEALRARLLANEAGRPGEE